MNELKDKSVIMFFSLNAMVSVYFKKTVKVNKQNMNQKDAKRINVAI
ncbi:MAG: hypothetical protein L3V56_02250 [Candidatus Magnetoovum sp. WYHC-5]|nr:hypothetical protein [Candidatus Magnetoovum sp. WYHC-5]